MGNETTLISSLIGNVKKENEKKKPKELETPQSLLFGDLINRTLNAQLN